VPALDRAGEILVTDLGDCAGDLGLRGIVQFDDRQAGIWRYEAEQAKGIFQGRRALFGERESTIATLRKRIAGFEAQAKLVASTDFPPRQ